MTHLAVYDNFLCVWMDVFCAEEKLKARIEQLDKPPHEV
jgi:hypothetical protein